MQSLLYSRADSQLERRKAGQTASFRLADHLHKLMISKEPAKEMRILGIGVALRERWREAYNDAGRRNEQALVRSEAVKLMPEISLALLSGAAALLVLLTTTEAAHSAGDYVLLFQCVTLLSGSVPGAVRQAGALSQLAIRHEAFAAYMALEEDGFAEGPGTPPAAAARFGVQAEKLLFRYDGPPHRPPALQEVSLEIENLALDPKAEREAFAAFVQAAAGRTAVLVTHRLGAAQLADRNMVG